MKIRYVLLLLVVLSVCASVAQDTPPGVVDQPEANPPQQLTETAKLVEASGETLPDAPSTVKTLTGEEETKSASFTQKLPESSALNSDRAVRHRVLTKAFVLSHAALFGASIADAVTTNRALRKGYLEDNPILGKHPSSGLVWGYAIGPAVGATILDYWLEKANPGGMESKVLPIVFGLAHSIAAWHNASIVNVNISSETKRQLRGSCFQPKQAPRSAGPSSGLSEERLYRDCCPPRKTFIASQRLRAADPQPHAKVVLHVLACALDRCR